jgi:hypothetical protein
MRAFVIAIIESAQLEIINGRLRARGLAAVILTAAILVVILGYL